MSETGAGRVASGLPTRGRGAVAASILAVLLIGGYFATSGEASALPAEFVIDAVVLALAFWFPAMRVGAPRDVVASWRSLLPWLLAWTLVWDLATSGITGGRALFSEWWLVYPSGVGTLVLLLLLHAFVVRRVGADRDDG